ncbi:MAG: hypothetical protein KDA91_21480 [Planctomycetaceae bacterium]|nr:hypothetical protein [Planctomycetaceae bacterium]
MICTSRQLICCGVFFCVTCIATGRVSSCTPDAGTVRSPKSEAPEKAEKIDAELVLAFADKHHPELAVLLRHLQSAKSNEFERAIRQLSAEITRLERSLERTPQRYKSDLASWQLESKARLLTARWVMSRDPELEVQIRKLLRQRRELRLEQMRQDRQRLEERLAATTDQINAAESNLDQQVDDEWQRLVRQTGAARKSVGEKPRVGQPAQESKQVD